jgi:hypothetical protein
VSDSAVPPIEEPKTRQQLRAERRARAREAAPVEPEEVEEPDVPPTVCAWCGFGAYFDDEASETEKEKCPACGMAYSMAPLNDDESAAYKRDAVHRRIANALDAIFALMNEQWEVQQEAMSRRY